MGTIELTLAAELRDALQLRRAVETGTYRGMTARALAALFESVVTIELSQDMHRQAVTALRDLSNVQAIQGHSSEVLCRIARRDAATLYFLDGHWSGGATAGAGDECPLLDELAAIGAGHEDDCLVIDDARLFTSAPPPPHDPAQWPILVEVIDAIRLRHPHHAVTLLDDQIIAVPPRARPALDDYGRRVQEASAGWTQRVLGALLKVQRRVTRVSAPTRAGVEETAQTLGSRAR
jgi:hypothetical protein